MMNRNRLRGNMKEYDDYFIEFFELEKRKIPGIFKFLNTKKRCMTVLIAAGSRRNGITEETDIPVTDKIPLFRTV